MRADKVTQYSFGDWSVNHKDIVDTILENQREIQKDKTLVN